MKKNQSKIQKSVKITFRVSKDEERYLKSLEKILHLSLSEIIRSTIFPTHKFFKKISSFPLVATVICTDMIRYISENYPDDPKVKRMEESLWNRS